jgi:peptide deformylase
MQLVAPDHPILHRVCRPSFVLDADVIPQMFTLLVELGGLGLAANQVGIDARLFVTAWGKVFVNPGILRAEGPCVSAQEGCLSLPGVVRFKSRCQRIVLAGGDTYEGQQAVVIQHEIDHLNGILLTDK